MSETFGNTPFAQLSGDGLPPGRGTTTRKDRGRVDIIRQTAGRGGKTVTVVANFIGVQQVEVPEAAEALLGASVLSTQEGVYLDAAGNRNGQYDLGDFLAAVDRSAAPKLAVSGQGRGTR